MGSRHTFLFGTTVVLWFCLGQTAVLGDDPVLRLGDVPDELVFPLPGGSNRIITATVIGATPQSVWLAKDKDAKLRVLLTKTGAGEYQINLADRDVGAALQKATGAGQFHIYAKVDDQKILESVPIGYAVRSTPRAKFVPRTCHVYFGDKNAKTVFACPGEYWIDTLDVRRIEFPAKAADRNTAPPEIVVSTGDMGWNLPLERNDTVYLLPLTSDIRKAWKEHGELTIGGFSPYRSYSAIVLNTRPKKLAFPGNLATIEIHQRQTEPVPGSNGYLEVTIGDITANQVMLTLRSADGKEPIHKASIQRGDSVPFRLGAEEYVLHLRKLVNLLIGDDFAVIDVSQVSSMELKEIDRLLAYIETAPVTFLREGKEYTGRETVIHLRQKLAAAGPRVRTVRQFIDKIASQSSVSGRPYLVRQSDGSTVPAKQWLRRALDENKGLEKKG